MSHAQILVTGGTGKVGRRIVAQLLEIGPQAKAATRKVSQSGEVAFDWADSAGFAAALEGVRAVYLIAPPADDMLGAMRPFLDQALAAGVERFVLQSASLIEAGGPMMGAVHAHLAAHAPRWSVLRPTWFMQNFSEQQHRQTICDESAIYSATEDGRVAFIDAADIAAVAVEALTKPDFPNLDYVLTGPKTLSYDEVASQISGVIGRKVVHRRVTEQELASRHVKGGMPEPVAKSLAAMDTAIAGGAEDRITDQVKAVTRKSPGNFQSFALENAGAWLAKDS